MTTDITELTQESARESGSILIIVAARMARREFFTPLHALCESGKRVVSTRALCDAVERAEEHMVSQVSKIVDGHDRLTKKLKEAESRNAELVEALEKARQRIAELDREQETLLPVGVMSEKAFRRLENSESRFIALWPRPGIYLPRKRPEDGVIVYARTAVTAAIATGDDE